MKNKEAENIEKIENVENITTQKKSSRFEHVQTKTAILHDDVMSLETERVVNKNRDRERDWSRDRSQNRDRDREKRDKESSNNQKINQQSKDQAAIVNQAVISKSSDN